MWFVINVMCVCGVTMVHVWHISVCVTCVLLVQFVWYNMMSGLDGLCMWYLCCVWSMFAVCSTFSLSVMCDICMVGVCGWCMCCVCAHVEAYMWYVFDVCGVSVCVVSVIWVVHMWCMYVFAISMSSFCVWYVFGICVECVLYL